MQYDDQKIYTIRQNTVGDFFMDIDGRSIYCGEGAKYGNTLEQISYRILQYFFDENTANAYSWEFGIDLIDNYRDELNGIYSRNFQGFKMCGIGIKETIKRVREKGRFAEKCQKRRGKRLELLL